MPGWLKSVLKALGLWALDKAKEKVGGRPE